MLAKVGRRFTYANVMASLALLVALSGGAYAATALAPANSVNSKAIIDGQVKTPDLGKAAVTGAKLAANSVNGGKVANNSLTGADVNESTLATVPNASHLGGQLPSAFFPSANVARIDFRESLCQQSAMSCPADVLTLGNLTLHANCKESVTSLAELELDVSAAGTSSTTDVGFDVSDGTSVQDSIGTGTVGTGTLFDESTASSTNGSTKGETGTIVYQDPGTSTTITVSFTGREEVASSAATCRLSGIAVETS